MCVLLIPIWVPWMEQGGDKEMWDKEGGEEAGCKGLGGGALIGLERCERSRKVKPTFLRQDRQCG